MRQYGPPQSPPPSALPSEPYSTYLIDCMNSYTYVWPIYGSPFWFYPTKVEYNKTSGYRWTGYYWIYYTFNPELVYKVECYPTPTLY